MPTSGKKKPQYVVAEYNIRLINKEVALMEGIANVLKERGFPLVSTNGSLNKSMILRETIRIAAAALGAEVGDTKLVKLADSFQGAFRKSRLYFGSSESHARRKRSGLR